MHFREGTMEDIPALVRLHRVVAATEGGLARRPDEITEAYIASVISKSITSGLVIVSLHPGDDTTIIGEVHAYKTGIAVFDHVLTDLTIAIHPEFQGRKTGRTLFAIFLEEISRHRNDIARVELIVRESNTRAIAFYQSLGFLIEGRLEMRIRTSDRRYEADIPMAWQNPNYEF